MTARTIVWKKLFKALETIAVYSLEWKAVTAKSSIHSTKLSATQQSGAATELCRSASAVYADRDNIFPLTKCRIAGKPNEYAHRAIILI